MTQSYKNKQQSASEYARWIRTQIHTLYGINEQGFFPFLFENYEFKENDKILELGCGDAIQWKDRIDQLPSGVTLVLSDYSQESLDLICDKIKNHPRVIIELIDIQEIPFTDQSFDVVIANHMLYHIQDLEQGLSEVERILKKNGTFYASTNGIHGIRHYLNSILKEFNPASTAFKEDYAFSMQNGGEILSYHFKDVSCIEYPDALVIPDVEPLLDWLNSITTLSDLSEYEVTYLKHYFHRTIQEKKEILIPKEVCLFIAKK